MFLLTLSSFVFLKILFLPKSQRQLACCWANLPPLLLDDSSFFVCFVGATISACELFHALSFLF